MLSRVVFILLTLFWLTMNVLLWRAEFGSSDASGNAVPADLVWQKILTAPDSSSLVISHRGEKIGVCHWVTSVGDEWANVSEENLPEGAPQNARAYGLRFEGSALLPDSKNRLRFEASLRLSETRDWQELNARITIRPMKVQIHATAADRSVQFKADTGEASFERVLKLADLQNPTAAVRELLGPVAGSLLMEMDLPPVAPGASPGGVLKWEAREDDLRVGHTPVKIYRLQTRLLDRYPIVFFVSRVGEILRVELPDEVVLANDQLSARSQ